MWLTLVFTHLLAYTIGILVGLMVRSLVVLLREDPAPEPRSSALITEPGEGTRVIGRDLTPNEAQVLSGSEVIANLARRAATPDWSAKV